MKFADQIIFACEVLVLVCATISGALFVVSENYGAAIWALIALGQTLKLLVERYAA